MSTAAAGHLPDGRVIVAFDVAGPEPITLILEEAMREPTKLYYALESLPELLGKGDMLTLRQALYAALPIGRIETVRGESETDGEYIARLIRVAAGVRYERAA